MARLGNAAQDLRRLSLSDDEIARRYSGIENYPSVNKAATREIIYFLAEEISRNTYLNIMAQYHPCHKSFQFALLGRAGHRR